MIWNRNTKFIDPMSQAVTQPCKMIRVGGASMGWKQEPNARPYSNQVVFPPLYAEDYNIFTFARMQSIEAHFGLTGNLPENHTVSIQESSLRYTFGGYWGKNDNDPVHSYVSFSKETAQLMSRILCSRAKAGLTLVGRAGKLCLSNPSPAALDAILQATSPGAPSVLDNPLVLKDYIRAEQRTDKDFWFFGLEVLTDAEWKDLCPLSQQAYDQGSGTTFQREYFEISNATSRLFPLMFICWPIGDFRISLKAGSETLGWLHYLQLTGEPQLSGFEAEHDVCHIVLNRWYTDDSDFERDLEFNQTLVRTMGYRNRGLDGRGVCSINVWQR